MRSGTFPLLIAVAPVARLPEGCSGQEGHKYFLMSINLITVLCKQGLCYGDRWMYLHFPPQKKKKKDKLQDILVSLIICFLGSRTCLVLAIIFWFSTFWQWNPTRTVWCKPLQSYWHKLKMSVPENILTLRSEDEQEWHQDQWEIAFCLLTKEVSRNGTPVCLVYLSRLRGLPPRAREHE